MGELNAIIHQPARLRIMAALTALSRGKQMEFSGAGEDAGLTDGNLGSHLQTLETAGYIQIEKVFVERKPKTLVAATAKGRSDFAEHVAALEEILARARGG